MFQHGYVSMPFDSHTFQDPAFAAAVALFAAGLVAAGWLAWRRHQIAKAEMRERYAAHLKRILPKEFQGLLITLDYDQAQMSGPPFAVVDDEVQRLFGASWALKILEDQDILSESGKFIEAGVTRLEERVYRLMGR